MKSLLILGLLHLTLTGHSQTLQEARWSTATVPPHRIHQADLIATRILRDKPRYLAVAKQTGVPWHVIAGLHNMESSGSFRHHLHEGSPLTGRTRWVPKGRPTSGNPPFTWETSAADALRYDSLPAVRWSSLDATLHACERYNGLGYLRHHPDVPTPYLWNHTTLQRPGKYITDGKWSSTAISNQTGIAAIWKRLIARKVLSLP